MVASVNKFLRDCDAQMNDYACRGVLSNLARVNPIGNHRLTYRFRWHLGRCFDLIADSKALKLTYPCILPGVDKTHAIDRDLRVFVKSLIGPEVVKHRRLAENPKSVRVINRKGSMAMSIAAEDDNTIALVERTIGLGHQIFTQFLRQGGYDDYLVDVFNIELDTYI